MLRSFAYVMLLSVVFLFGCDQAYAASRIKDIVDIEGVRKNQLVGYGLVGGLNGTGDTLRNSPFTKQSLEAMLERLGVNTSDANMETKDAAAVIVTAELPAFGAAGAGGGGAGAARGGAGGRRGGARGGAPGGGAGGGAD